VLGDEPDVGAALAGSVEEQDQRPPLFHGLVIPTGKKQQVVRPDGASDGPLEAACLLEGIRFHVLTDEGGGCEGREQDRYGGERGLHRSRFVRVVLAETFKVWEIEFFG